MSKTLYLYLFITVIAEVIAVSALKETQQFTKLFPSLIVIAGYAVTLYFLTLVMQSMPMGIAYALWAAFGIIFVVLVGVFYYKESIDLPAIIGLLLIIVGIVIINVYSKVVS